MPRIAHALNRLVIVAVPAFFGDKAPHRAVLVDIEPTGLWLCGAALNERLGHIDDLTPPADTFPPVFFPWEQIGFLFDPAQCTQLTEVAARMAAFAPPPTPHARKTHSKPSR